MEKGYGIIGKKGVMHVRLGELIKAKREANGLTQQELASRLFVSRQTVCRWENGTRCPDLIMLKKIAMVLGIPLDELVSGEAVTDYVPEKESSLDISCVKVMLTGLMLVLIGTFLVAADSGNGEISAFCFITGILAFVVGLFIPWNKKAVPVKNDDLPQRKCPKCGMEHDFDYPKCPYCYYDYSGKE